MLRLLQISCVISVVLCQGPQRGRADLKSDKPYIAGNPPTKGCGFRNIDGVGVKKKGDSNSESQFGEFPWMVAILKEEPALQQILNVYQCGGSLIHPSVVLTAAHCVSGKNASTLKIRAGEWDTQTRNEILPHQDRSVSNYVIHPEYYEGGLFNDIALLFLSEPVELKEHIKTACLPLQDNHFDGSKCFVTGWGKDLFGKEGRYQVIMKRIELPIVPRTPCLENLRKTRLGHHFELHKSFICAGGEKGIDACKGDGGSPLVCPINGKINQYTQAGIVSWGIGCKDATPAIYVNVALFRNWIEQQMKNAMLNTLSYIP